MAKPKKKSAGQRPATRATAKPAKPAKPPKAFKPAKAAKPAKPAKHSQASKAAKAGRASNAAKPAKPAKPAKRATLTKPAKVATRPSSALASLPPKRGVLSAPWAPSRPLDASGFLAALPPMEDVMQPTKSSLARLGHRLPKRMLDFFLEVGFGRFGNGFLSILHPHELDETLADWLGSFDPTRVPFARTALGDIVYFRDLRIPAQALGLAGAKAACEVSAVEVRRKRALLLASDLPPFIEGVLANQKALETVLRKDLFDRAFERLGPPEPDEVYGFVPALAVGGREEPAALERTKAQEHLATLLQL